MNVLDLQACWLTVKLAVVSTIALLLIGVPLGWWLARDRSLFGRVAGAVVSLPLVLPPTVIGFYLLLLLGPKGPIGHVAEALNFGPLVFSFEGLVIGSIVYSLPFVVSPIRSGFASIQAAQMEAAAVLRASPLDRFFTIAIPMNRTGLLTATALGFAHTIGEFGVVLMIGGSIPGETRVLSVAIFERVEGMDYAGAHVLAAAMLSFSFLILIALQFVNRRAEGTWP